MQEKINMKHIALQLRCTQLRDSGGGVYKDLQEDVVCFQERHAGSFLYAVLHMHRGRLDVWECAVC